jgi:hypothetical protein
VFWQPELCSSIVSVTLRETQELKPADCFRLPEKNCDVTILALPDGHEHLLLRRDNCAVQLQCGGAALRRTGEYQILYELDFKDLEPKLITIKRLRALFLSQPFPRQLIRADPRGRRLHLILQALDGHLAGASYREIAIALFGVERVQADWSDASRSLRDQIKYSVHRGLYLMREGYRQFLK